jgi:hypothetical protein
MAREWGRATGLEQQHRDRVRAAPVPLAGARRRRERERGVYGGWEGSWRGRRSAQVFIALQARVPEGVGELWAAVIVGGCAAGHVADIRAPPLGKLREGRARAKGAGLISLLWGPRASVIHGTGHGLA